MHLCNCIHMITNITGTNDNPHVKQPFYVLNFWYTEPNVFSTHFFSNQLKTSRRAIFRGTGVKRVYKIIVCGLTRNYILNIKDQNFSHQ